MARKKNTEADRKRAGRLASTLRRARGDRSRNDLAALTGVAPDTIKRIEDSRTADPGFFTVASLASALGLRLDDLARVARGRRSKS